jgi:YVTN family beta-propeller protein
MTSEGRKLQFFHIFVGMGVVLSVQAVQGADFRPPAGQRYALVTASGTVLPGGRILKPWGTGLETGPAPFALAVSPKGTVAAADIGFERFGITIIDPPGKRTWQLQQIWARTPGSKTPERADPEWKGVADGIAFESEKTVWVSEGDSGRVRLIDIGSEDTRAIVNLNSGQWTGSYSAQLARDSVRRFLYVVDRANARVAVIDEKTRRVVASVKVGGLSFDIALSPDGDAAYVTIPESNSVVAIDVSDPRKPHVTGSIRTASPSEVLATGDRVFVSNERDDSITVISARDWKITAEIALRIPALETLRGIMPAGMAFDPVTKWLLVAETGINAVAVVDTAKNELLGHIPAGWMPTRVAVSGDRVYVANARGRGTGPNVHRPLIDLGEPPALHRGSVTTFILPSAAELPEHTRMTLAANGFVPDPRDPPGLPDAVKYVVLIVKRNHSFDEVLGDMPKALGSPTLARFGMYGRGDGGRGQFSVQDVPITPNQHAIAGRWAFSDNFYADGNISAEGESWLAGDPPDLLSETRLLAAAGGRHAPGVEQPPPEAIWRHLEKNGVISRNFADTNVSDQRRADQFISEVDRRYVKGGEPFPRFISIRLPNDNAGAARPADGYPYESSFIADNDLAVGRILDYLSHSRWWPAMTVLVAEDSAQGGLDHVDAHRTLLLAAGPFVKRNYLSHTNTSFPGLVRTAFELLHVPPMNLMDATAASLADMFTDTADFTPFTAKPEDPRIFDPGR